MKHTKLRYIATAAMLVLLSACAKPNTVTSNPVEATDALRAAQLAGAETYAPQAYAVASQTYDKAEKLLRHNRKDRANKLLLLAVAQADLAKAISEAEHAEESLMLLQAAASNQ